ncbi:hypothetical protein KQX54_007398 [Cotesia glomerata]|uniref:Uncharacterized protein n=2 Tax=Cotesia glomerata TaxID=32391 RepID=A0AAV7IQD6_COTGL|nr:hypothetical protein KQX54_007398 [Cotesia glomerata]
MKIYRKSTIKFDVMKVNNLLNISKNLFFNVTNHTNCDSEGIYGDIRLKPSKVSVPTDFDQLNDSDRYKNYENLSIHKETLNTNQNFSKISENYTNELKNKPIDSSTQLYITTKSPLFDFTEEKTKSNKKKQSYSYYLLNYIPINQLKRVHIILIENLGKTHKEKLEFLQSFKNDLSKTIRSMIPEVINRNADSRARKKRGSSWDEHDSHIGFPSLEGALLAISFLTFAIYLIRLIMMLMKNFGNNTTGSTILINRNKRFITELTEEAARIHGYLHEFDSRFQSRRDR